MGNDFCFAWEIKLMAAIQQHLAPWAVGFFKIITEFGDATFLVAILGFIYWAYNKEMGKKVGIVLLVSTFLNPMIKDIFLRRRPYFDHPEVTCLKKVSSEGDLYDIAAQGYSFPSGHSMSAASTYGGIQKRVKQKAVRTICVLLILLVGISRFCLGVHYPTDVLVGWGVGLLLVMGVPFLQAKIGNDRIFYGVLILCALPGIFYCRENDYFTGLGILIGFILGDLFERRYVNFANTRKLPAMIARTVGGLAIYLGVNSVLKLPFSTAFLNSQTLPAFLVRTGRYTIVMFLLIGVYPMLFKWTTRKNK